MYENAGGRFYLDEAIVYVKTLLYLEHSVSTPLADYFPLSRQRDPIWYIHRRLISRELWRAVNSRMYTRHTWAYSC
jgi:hypothetical protein